MQQLGARVGLLESMNRINDGRISNLENNKQTLSQLLTKSNNAQQMSITNLNTLTANSLSVQSGISSLNNGTLNNFSNIDTFKTISGNILSHTTLQALSFLTTNNTVGTIEGTVITRYSTFDFAIFCNNVSGSATILNTTYKGFTQTDYLSFSTSGARINIYYHNSLNNPQRYIVKYYANFQAFN